ncbi:MULTISPECIES: pentapeptide repeat-containing protein [Kitasatospora]|uniref:pentapeptide repeat-containing protein n=1 Tax=Kitasatospora TaxID=2063 RepID=UPI0006876BDD|nr:pentapeptide repeat-containing protein [Kitasatospora setae]
MRAYVDSFLGRAAAASVSRRPWLRITVSPWWARVLIAAGAQAQPAVSPAANPRPLDSDSPGAEAARTSSRIVEGLHVHPGVDLTGADLTGVYLSGANLRGAYLTGANLRGAYLTGANLRGTNLRDTYLASADLRDADLRNADLRDADLRDANLTRADLSGANLRDADLTAADLSGADLTAADLTRANLRAAYLNGANLTRADLSGTDLSGANLTGESRIGQVGGMGPGRPTLLVNVTWSDETQWPDDVGSDMRRRSEPLGDGRYRVLGSGNSDAELGVSPVPVR